MSENRIVLSEGDVFLSADDKRSENWRLAIRLFLRELRALRIDSVDKIFKRWSVKEIEMGDAIRLGIDFPADLDRYQWFRTEGYELKKVNGIQVKNEKRKA